jgi:hypothetical protein
MEIFTDREQAQIAHAAAYAEAFSDAGIPGHTHFLLIAKLANNLGELLTNLAEDGATPDPTANPVHPLLQHLDETVGVITQQIGKRGLIPGLLVEATKDEDSLKAILAVIFREAVESGKIDWEQLLALCHVAVLQQNHPEIWEA